MSNFNQYTNPNTSPDMTGKKYCKFCGSIIDENCVVCPHCGKQVEELRYGAAPQPQVIINNSNQNVNSNVYSVPF